MYSQPVIIAKYHSFMTLWWGLFRDNDHLTVHYLAYYAGTHQISEYTENKYRLRLKIILSNEEISMSPTLVAMGNGQLYS